MNWGLANTDITTKWTMRMDADEELTPELVKEIEEKLLATTSFKQMEMHFMVDEELIGGMVIRIGDRVVDSSIKTKLFEMRRTLLKTKIEQ